MIRVLIIFLMLTTTFVAWSDENVDTNLVRLHSVIPDLLTDFLASEEAKAGDRDAEDDLRQDVAGEVRICVCSSCTAGGGGHWRS